MTMLTGFTWSFEPTWETLGYDAAAHGVVARALPAGWSISHDWAYCGSSKCRNIELHQDHSGDDHQGCYRTLYGSYATIAVSVADGLK